MNCLRSILLDRHIEALAEEMHDDFLGPGAKSLCGQLAGELSLRHVMCDPTDVERSALGYISEIEYYYNFDNFDGRPTAEMNSQWLEFDRKQWHIRESFWFKKVKSTLTENLLFVCGAAHIDSFMTLLANEGFEAQILYRRWHP